MATIIVGWTPTAEGEAALRHAVDEARERDDSLVVVNVSARSDPPETFADEDEVKDLRGRMDSAGVSWTLRQLVRGNDVPQEIIGLADEHQARSIVIGLRHRTPVGKLLLGSNSQRILLEATCPVVAVKAQKVESDG